MKHVGFLHQTTHPIFIRESTENNKHYYKGLKLNQFHRKI